MKNRKAADLRVADGLTEDEKKRFLLLRKAQLDLIDYRRGAFNKARKPMNEFYDAYTAYMLLKVKIKH